MNASLYIEGREHHADSMHVSHGSQTGDLESWVIVFLGGDRSLQMTRETARQLGKDLLEAADA